MIAGNEKHAVVIGLGTNGLAVVRALARNKVPTSVLVSKNDANTPYYYTRFATKIVLPTITGEYVLNFLKSFEQPTVLFPTLEHIVAWLSTNRESIPTQHILLFPEKEVVDTLLDKEKFENFARTQSLPIPASWIARTPSDIHYISRACRFPVIVKPVHKLSHLSLPKAQVATDKADLAQSLSDYYLSGSQCIVQEFIPGGDNHVVFCMQYINKHGELKASFAGRKIRQWRPLSGGTASCEPINAPQLHDLTLQIFRKARFWGIGSLEYKLDPRDGNYYCIEPTVCRTDFQEYVAICNGVNIPYMAYMDTIGQKAAPIVGSGGTKAWMHFTNDRLAADELIQSNQLTRFGWLRSLGKVRAFDFFSINDTGPLFFFLKTTIKNRLGM